MHIDTKASAFAFGAFRGILPTIATLASTYVSAPDTPLPALGMYLGILLWALVGGGVALTNTSYEARQAIFAGVAAPAIVLNIVAGATSQPPSDRNAGLFGISAYAQPISPDTQDASNWAVIVSPKVSGGIPRGVSIPVTAEIKTGDQTTIVDLGKIRDFNSPTAFVVPPGASQILVSGQPVSPTGNLTKVDLSVTTKPSVGGDLLWALGAPRDFSIRQLEVHPASP